MNQQSSIGYSSLKPEAYQGKIIQTILVLFTAFILTHTALATTYYSKGGSFSTLSNWSTTRDGTGTSPAYFNTAGDVFIIQGIGNGAGTPHVVILSRSSYLNLGTGATLQVEPGATFEAKSPLNLGSTSTFILDSAATYIHNYGYNESQSWLFENILGGTEIFSPHSHILIKEIFGAMPMRSQMSCNIGHLTYAASKNTICHGALPEVIGNLTINGTGRFELVNENNQSSLPLIINGNLTLSNGAKLRLSTGPATEPIYLKGNLTINNATISNELSTNQTGPNVTSFFYFNGSVPQKVSITNAIINSAPTRTIIFRVLGGSTVHFDTSTLKSTAGTDVRFILDSAATLITANTHTLGALTKTSAAGCIQVLSRSFSNYANYIFSGSSPQATGDGLPSEVNNLEINNPTSVSLTQPVSINANLLLSLGVFQLNNNRFVIPKNTQIINGTIQGSAATLVFRHFYGNVPNGLLQGSFQNIEINLPHAALSILFADTLKVSKQLYLLNGKLQFTPPACLLMDTSSLVTVAGGQLNTPAIYRPGVDLLFAGSDSLLNTSLLNPQQGAICCLKIMDTTKITLQAHISADSVHVASKAYLNTGHYAVNGNGAHKISGTLVCSHPNGLQGTFQTNPLVFDSTSTVHFSKTDGSQMVDSNNYYQIILSGGQKEFNGSKITIAGNLTSTALFVQSADTMVFSSRNRQVINSTRMAYKSLILDGIGPKIFEGRHEINNAVMFSNSPGLIDFDGPGDTCDFVLRSTDSSTAFLGNTYNFNIQGNIVTEHYNGKYFHPDSSNRRAFRFIAHPFKTAIGLNSITDDIDITGIGGALSGFTPTQLNNPSAFWYNTNTAQWIAFTNTNGLGNNAWLPTQGIRVLLRGSKGQGLVGGSYNPAPAVLSMNGVPNFGNVTVPLIKGVDGYNLVGNPYPAPIQTQQVFDHEVDTNLVGTCFWIWDPYDAAQGRYKVVPFGDDFVLPAASAFFVQVKDSTSVTFTENHKSDEKPNRQLLKGAKTSERLHIRMVGNGRDWDDLYIFYRSKAINGLDNLDGKKLSNPDANLYSLSSDSVKLALDSRPLNQHTVIRLGIGSKIHATYSFVVAEMNLPDTLEVFLYDSLHNVNIPLTKTTEYSFVIDGTSSTQGESRFSLVFKNTSILATNSINLKASRHLKNIHLAWTCPNNENIIEYHIERSFDGVLFSPVAKQICAFSTEEYKFSEENRQASFYRIRSVSKTYENSFSNAVYLNSYDKHPPMIVYTSQSGLSLYFGDFPVGKYTLIVTASDGKIILMNDALHYGIERVKNISLSKAMAKGIYLWRLTNATKQVSSKFVVH